MAGPPTTPPEHKYDATFVVWVSLIFNKLFEPFITHQDACPVAQDVRAPVSEPVAPTHNPFGIYSTIFMWLPRFALFQPLPYGPENGQLAVTTSWILRL